MPHLPLIVWVVFGASLVAIRILLLVERHVVSVANQPEDETFEIQLPKPRSIRLDAAPALAEPRRP